MRSSNLSISPERPDLDAITERAEAARETIGPWEIRESAIDVPALVAYARHLEARAEHAEAERYAAHDEIEALSSELDSIERALGLSGPQRPMDVARAIEDLKADRSAAKARRITAIEPVNISTS